MIYSVTLTPGKTVSYPLHSHSYKEIMFYIEGEGYIRTDTEEKVEFEKNTVIIVPPHKKHGSYSEKGFRNISIGADFMGLFDTDGIVSFGAEEGSDIEKIARMILKNYNTNPLCSEALCEAYAYSIASQTPKVFSGQMAESIDKIKENIMRNFTSKEIDVTGLLDKSGWAQDYIRAKFKERVGMTPIAFLNKMRIDYAKKICEIFSENISVEKIADMCGFYDSVYFSKCFKKHTGICPRDYISKNSANG